MFLFDFNSIINYNSDEFLFSNIDKGQATTIVLIVAGVIEGLLLIALFLNIAKKAKSAKNRGEAARMFDNSPTSTPSFAYQDPTPAPAVDPVMNDNVNTMDDMYNANNTVVAMNDSGIPSMDYNQPTTFDSENLMESQMNDTLDVPTAEMSYDNNTYSATGMNDQGLNDSYDNNLAGGNTGFGSLENLPEIIEDNSTNSDPLPTTDEIGNNPSEVVEAAPIDLNSGIPEMDYNAPVDNGDMNLDMPVEQPTDFNSMPMDQPTDMGMVMDTPPVDYNNDISTPDMSYDNSTFNNDLSLDTPMDTSYDTPIDTGVDYNYNMNLDVDTPVVPDMNYDMPMDQPVDMGLDTPVQDFNYDMPNTDDNDPNNY